MTEIKQIPEGYKEDAKGNLIPLANIREIDLLRDEEVIKMITEAKEQQDQLRIFKNKIFDTIASFVDLSLERYNVKRGGKKGNVTLTSFDGRYKVLFVLAERLSFDEGLQAAKALIDECLHDMTEDANPSLKIIVNGYFAVDKEGKINTQRVLSLRQYKVPDPRWAKAMDAISDAVKINEVVPYVRFYEKDSKGKYQTISLDFASL
ncbi:MAG: DUF3164 family protein [Gammaproteobacteria bacterium]|nr:DUF3164 family protein [Gammaproteobacteria bacterium]